MNWRFKKPCFNWHIPFFLCDYNEVNGKYIERGKWRRINFNK